MPDLDLPALRAIAEAATPGPWQQPVMRPWDVHQINGVPVADTYGDDWLDASYIATFDPPTVLSLLNELDSKSRKIESLIGVILRMTVRAEAAEAELEKMRQAKELAP